jgi:hypothetical protein
MSQTLYIATTVCFVFAGLLIGKVLRGRRHWTIRLLGYIAYVCLIAYVCWSATHH